MSFPCQLTEAHSAVAGSVAGADSAARLAALLQLLVRVASVLGTLAEISCKADVKNPL